MHFVFHFNIIFHTKQFKNIRASDPFETKLQIHVRELASTANGWIWIQWFSKTHRGKKRAKCECSNCVGSLSLYFTTNLSHGKSFNNLNLNENSVDRKISFKLIQVKQHTLRRNGKHQTMFLSGFLNSLFLFLRCFFSTEEERRSLINEHCSLKETTLWWSEELWEKTKTFHFLKKKNLVAYRKKMTILLIIICYYYRGVRNGFNCIFCWVIGTRKIEAR